MRRSRHVSMPLPAGALLVLALLAQPSLSQGEPPAPASGPVGTTAREGLDLAREAAFAWEADAALIYVENDETLAPDGRSARWGYLFYSPSRDKSRVYSVRGNEIVVAENLDVAFEAPPLASGWLDSGDALAVAEKKAGAEYRKEFGGNAETVLLMRGAFHDKKPDLTTWTVIYTSPSAPSLFVVVDAATGKVTRKWRG